MAIERSKGLRSALRHFPDRVQRIEALERESENFRDICDELAAAEDALAAIDSLGESQRAERRLEWLGFIRSTLLEIEAELRRSNVIRIDQGGH
jgi:hypothetical protein